MEDKEREIRKSGYQENRKSGELRIEDLVPSTLRLRFPHYMPPRFTGVQELTLGAVGRRPSFDFTQDRFGTGQAGQACLLRPSLFSSSPLPIFYEGVEKAFRIQKILLDEKTTDLV